MRAHRAHRPKAPPSPAVLRRRLLAWYDRHRRRLPWRAERGQAPDPYRVWLSEIMLQQTTVAAAIPYYERFVARWPTVRALAAARLDEVLHAWQGLGYYARARNLHATARRLTRERGGRFPDTEAELRRLPGVGSYTAAAVAAIAFGRRAAPVDANVARVLARLGGVGDPPGRARRRIAELAAALAPARRAGDFAQALMDLGATVCAPKRPDCGRCPWAGPCVARAAGDPEAFPAKARTRERPTRRGVVFWAERTDGAVLLRRRPAKGLLGGLMEFPTTAWRERAWRSAEARAAAPLPAKWRTLAERVRHGFTHFHLELTVLAARVDEGAVGDGIWCPVGRLREHALSTLMRKVARAALAHGRSRGETGRAR
jgi:A/G-specific adenine glycosylase